MTTDLTTKKTTSIIDANKETDNAIYEVRYQVVDIKGAKNLQAVHEAIQVLQQDGCRCLRRCCQQRQGVP